MEAVQCPHCGTGISGSVSFCPECGQAMTAAPQSVAPATDAAPAPSSEPGVPLPIPENIAAVIAYMTPIPAVAFLYLEPFRRNVFVRFHAFQHIILWCVGMAFAIGSFLLWMLLQLIPFMRALVFPFAGLIALAWFFLWLLLVVKAYHHEMFKLPYIGDFVEEWSLS
jgi:uncharacterized membrane protein